jgi:hypothetical protein
VEEQRPSPTQEDDDETQEAPGKEAPNDPGQTGGDPVPDPTRPGAEEVPEAD